MRVVAKIGTASLTDSAGDIVHAAIEKLCTEVAGAISDGHEVLIVSSGAVAAGVAAVGLTQRPSDMTTLQAVSAAGQSRLMEVYNAALGVHDRVAAQVLLDPHDFVDRSQYLHARRTLERLLELGCVPVINENDAIASEELRYGDNDRLAALVAHAVRADLLVLLTDADGLYTADPRTDPSASLIPLVTTDDPLLSIKATAGGSGRGSGGMASKLEAARIASWSGIRTVIARAAVPDALAGAVDGRGAGTTFAAHARRLTARRLWIAFAAEVLGDIHVDDGARTALVSQGRSLLAAGITEVQGSFEAGDTVDVHDSAGVVFARGRVTRRADDLRGGEDDSGLVPPEVIHRDDLVILPA